MDKRPPKTIKEKKFVKAYLKSGNGTQAALEAYDTTSPKIAGVIASQNLSRLSISDIMERMGITDDRLMQVLDEGLEATRSVSPTTGKPSDEQSVEFVDIPDYQTRHKYLETGLKLKDKFPSTKVDSTINFSDVVDKANKYVK